MKAVKKGLALSMALVLAVPALTAAPESSAAKAKKPALNKKTANVTVGKTVTIKVKNAKKKATVKWAIKKTDIAKIKKKTTKGNAYATIQGKKAGTTKLTATYKYGKTKKPLTCTINVTPKKPVTTSAPASTTTPPANSGTSAPAATPTEAPTPTPVPTPGPTDPADFQSNVIQALKATAGDDNDRTGNIKVKNTFSYTAEFTAKEDSNAIRFIGPKNKTAIKDLEISSVALARTTDELTESKDDIFKPYTDENGVYHHFLGTILGNPSLLYGEFYNNHHHMQSFKGHYYMFYHSTILSNLLFRSNKQYRNLHVDEITVNSETDEISMTPSYEGASQIEDFSPYKNADNSTKVVNATTAANSAGIDALRDDIMVENSVNGSPMVVNNIDTGDWTSIKGIDFGTKGLKSLTAEIKVNADSEAAVIEMFLDDPTKLANKVATIEQMASTDGKYVFKTAKVTKEVKGKHDVFFVFRGSKFNIASWIFSEDETPSLPDISKRTSVQGDTAKNVTARDSKPTMAPQTQNYEYFNDYTLGYSGGIVAYKNGQKVSLEAAGAKLYNKKTDNVFAQHIENNNWYQDKIILTQPAIYTTDDGKTHPIDSMLTNYSLIADPTAIDNSENDGKLYVYGTTEGLSYSGDTLGGNSYANHSLTILSTQDMVNWTDEGTVDTQNLTNLPSTASGKVKNRWAGQAWAPSGLKIDGDGDGKDEFYLFHTNGGASGYVMSKTPVGPWTDPAGKTLFDKNLGNCFDCANPFDPAVLADDKGRAYVYFGGLGGKFSSSSARGVEIKFAKDTGYVSTADGGAVRLPALYHFEDNEINQFNGKYYYSYCSAFGVGAPLIGEASICCYVSSDPLDIAFDPSFHPSSSLKDVAGYNEEKKAAVSTGEFITIPLSRTVKKDEKIRIRVEGKLNAGDFRMYLTSAEQK